MSAFRFDAFEFRERAETRLLSAPPARYGRSDDDLNPGSEGIPMDLPHRPAAVLVPVVLRSPELSVLLTRRTPHLTSHAGQIAFPGGKIDDADDDAVGAALREAEEETGLERSFVEPLGFLDGYLTRTSFRVIPVVGLVRPGFTLVPEPGEVAEVFEVPLRFLMSAENHARHSVDWKGRTRFYYAMPYGERYIWGATAGMIRNLYDRMYAEP
jgi:8-oxo-dGTP pyrophosphatase MutT (NUDIX family)